MSENNNPVGYTYFKLMNDMGAKSADKMLSSLGYMHMVETDGHIIWILYGHEYAYEIDFYKYKKEVAYRVIERETDTIIDISGMSMSELKAINKKCEELGWL